MPRVSWLVPVTLGIAVSLLVVVGLSSPATSPPQSAHVAPDLMKCTSRCIGWSASGLPIGTKYFLIFDGKRYGFTYPTAGEEFVVNKSSSNPWSFPALPGFKPEPSSGVVVVNSTYGISGTIATYFKPLHPFTVKFHQTGLPAKTNWTLDVDAIVDNSTGGSMAFHLANGSYDYTMIPTEPHPGAGVYANGTATVAGASFTVHLALYKFTLKESGLPSGTNWSMSVSQAPHYDNVVGSETNTTAFGIYLTNGSYNFVVSGVTGYTPNPFDGSFTLQGKAVSESIKYKPS